MNTRTRSHRFDSSTPTFQFNDVVSASGSAYAGICADHTGLNGNVSADPLFRNPSASDYHLQAGSPAIDSGTSAQAPQTDTDGVLRPQDGNGDGLPAFDMGAYEMPSPDRMPPITTATATPLAWPHLHDHRDSYRCGRQFRYCDDHLQCSQITISPER